MNKQRFQELAGIKINELQVNKPLTKKQLITNIISFDEFLLHCLLQAKDINELAKNEGYDSFEEFLAEVYQEEENINKAKNLIELYYKYIKPGDVVEIEFPQYLGYDITNIENFKNLIFIQTDDRDHFFYLTKF